MCATISEAGRIGNDGKLHIPMDRLNAFFGDNKECRVVATFKVYERGTTDSLRGYYYGYIVPACRKALLDLGTRATENEVDEQLRDLYPGNTEEMGRREWSDFIEWIKQFAAENLYVYIEDTRVL